MEIMRKPFQGVLNIIRFNWHFYLLAVLALILSMLIINFFPTQNSRLVSIIILLIFLPLLISLLISFYVYDLSDLYQLSWIEGLDGKKVLNINAGFDATSHIIKHKYPLTELTVCDFYDPDTHTEVSIKRARKCYPPGPETIQVSTSLLPFPNNTFAMAFAILSAHEIRNNKERVQFFLELSRVTSGQIFVTEHLRNMNNFLAYTIGFFHFHSRKTWINAFNYANLKVVKEIKSTPFVTTFVLLKHGNPS